MVRHIASEKEQRVILEDFDCQPILQKKPICMDLFMADIRISRKTHLVINCHSHTWDILKKYEITNSKQIQSSLKNLRADEEMGDLEEG